ncbi:MAG: anti-anti-sigma factor [Oceanospirillaceae bacterium]|uniref:STAS domain-containing protein n=1 Tax=unclassified Thalassolituus TaxID=2624967 RepID=UPI000C096511|nr:MULTISPECIES: STAS domain-containing protein [unclassified Thalassolituus]MAD45732.1 anti-anti-sigma factor [Oceanospirillaceae bacterium]MAK90902.1 anti-anti-sigma factor [Thalassolituus sp.]MAX99199.1 anti-anti-sigma factor [Oceanospirillaceae bacterium]MBL33704.1 anti-anti-sigma factor [Oceanospirillaceae bacterium]MBS51702.1 anti-anti-sigma factor [Oceanospirillaceae bacterium]|tara:strand:- start:45955 stop:46260 length:306 start_codon:yes stop_codon:yes gene_type:complete
MGVQASLAGDGRELTIKVDGRFDFSAHQDFRDAYENTAADVKSFVVDLGKTSYLDSSALGMLLLLRDFAGGDNANVQIVNCNQDVRKILTISNFEQLFQIH